MRTLKEVVQNPSTKEIKILQLLVKKVGLILTKHYEPELVQIRLNKAEIMQCKHLLTDKIAVLDTGLNYLQIINNHIVIDNIAEPLNYSVFANSKLFPKSTILLALPASTFEAVNKALSLS